MCILKNVKAGILSCIMSAANVAWAGIIAAPGIPSVKYMAAAPEWLGQGKGDDGYVSVVAQISTDATCKNLGSAGVLGVGKESVQIVASVRSSGFSTNLNGQTLPLATFDSRANPGECNGLNTLPLTIIPVARLERESIGNPGQLTMIFDVKSTSSSDVNLVATAQFALGAAAVFASGGAAGTVTGLSSKLAQPALQLAENKVNASKSSILSGQATSAFTWAELRKGVNTITVPVYGGKAKRGKEGQAIENLKKSTDPNVKLFDIVLTFKYQRSLFEDLEKTGDVPKGESIARSRILSYPNWDGRTNGITLLQLLNGSSPSLLQDAASTQSTKEWMYVCDRTLNSLRNAGLTQMDRAIVLKSFIDEAKEGADWYSPPNVDACLNNLSDLKADMIRVFGPLGRIFTVKDTMGGAGEEYLKWKYSVPPTLAQFRNALTMKEAKADLLAALSSADFKLQFWPDSTEWLAGQQIAPSGSVARLAAKEIKRAGCFVYADDSELNNAAGYGAHMILLGESDDLWHAQLKMAPNDVGKISYVHLSRLDNDWKTYFQAQTYNGGECSGIIKNL